MQRVVQIGHLLIGAVDRQRVLDQVVGADREEIGFAGQRVGGERRARHLDHRAERRQCLRHRHAAAAQPAGHLLHRLAGAADLADGRDHWQEHPHRPFIGGAQHRRELRIEQAAFPQ